MIHLETIAFSHDLSEFTEIIDVRSPAEYELDHIPGAINLPVLNNQERVIIGTLYKENPFEARKQGAALISKNVANYLENQLSSKGLDYRPLLYCWRGGMRSRSMTTILKSIGWKAEVLQGGYRAFRQFVVKELETQFSDTNLNFQVLSGLTGVGKTRLLHAIKAEGGQIIDLEGLANHKGSLLGAAPSSDQPTQKKFETLLWHEMKQIHPAKPVYIEAESNRIGNVHCPPGLWNALNTANVIHIELPIDQRIILLREDYPHFQDDPDALTELLEILVRLRGHEQVDRWKASIDEENWDSFVESILINHYDLCYRQPGDEKSNYQAASATVEVERTDEASYQKAAREILAIN